jgi:hypothetical protein
MAEKLDIACPSCGKGMKVPAEVVGKVIRCKACSHTFTVADPAAKPRPAVAKPVPAKAAPVKAKPVPPAAAKDGPIKFQDDAPAVPAATGPAKIVRPFDMVEEENENPYGVTKDDLDVPRCPFCAGELDPPDTKVCLECGYNLLERKRHASKKVYETTAGDYFKHWLPAIAWIVVLLALFTLAIVSTLQMGDWLTGSFLEKDDKNPVTLQPEFYLPPFAFNLCTWVCTCFIFSLGIKFIVKRLIYNWRPTEVVKK